MSRGTQVYTLVCCVFVYGTITRSGRPFQDRSTNTPQSSAIKCRRTLQPSLPCGNKFGLFRVRSPLLTESLLLSLPRLTKMFQFSQCPSQKIGITPYYRYWVSPFGHPRIKAYLAAPRGLSQPATSFIGIRCLGIHHILLSYKRFMLPN